MAIAEAKDRGGRELKISPQMIAQFVAGDRDAFQAIFKQLRRDVFFVVQRIFHGPFDQEEAQQEAWLQIYRMRGRVDVNRPAEFVGWVKTVARNRAIDLLKGKGRKMEIPSDDVNEAEDGQSTPDPLREAMDRRIRVAIQRFTSKLDPQDRQFFELCFEQELSHPEIASRLAINERRSKYLKKKLLAKLIRCAPLRDFAA